MRNIHVVTMPENQAFLWYQTLTALGIKATKIAGSVKADAPQADLEAAWQIFKEEWERQMN